MPGRNHNAKKASLVGVWRSAGDFGSQVEYRVRKKGSGYRVTARDVGDGELADIFEEKWDPRAAVLSFAAHWNSTGRFLRCRLQMTSKEKAELTYTFTDTDIMMRHDKKG